MSSDLDALTVGRRNKAEKKTNMGKKKRDLSQINMKKNTPNRKSLFVAVFLKNNKSFVCALVAFFDKLILNLFVIP